MEISDPLPYPRPLLREDQIRAIVFDLDGTLYVSPGLAAEIQAAAASLIAASRGVSPAKGRSLLNRARARLHEIEEEEPTLTRACQTMGIEPRELHAWLAREVRPERHLGPDLVTAALLDSLRERCRLYLYTNNNLSLTGRILELLGLTGLFERVFTIEYTWQPKPHAETLRRILAEIGGSYESFLFVGDRRQIDLKWPAAWGIPTLLVRETSELLLIHKALGIIP